MFRLVWFVLVYGLVQAGCSVMRPAIEQTSKVTISEIERDTVFLIEPDEAYLKAWLACDSLNQVVMTRLEEKDGRLIRLSAALESEMVEVPVDETAKTVRIPAQYITFTAQIDSQAVYLAWKEKHVLEQEATTETVYVKVRKPPWWIVGLALLFASVFITWMILLIKKLV